VPFPVTWASAPVGARF